MFIAVAALLFQFAIFPPSNTQATQKASEASAAARTSEGAAASNKLDSHAAQEKKEVLSAEKLSADTDASVAYEPGRLVPEPVAPVNSALADPVANPASPVAIEPAPAVYGPVSPIYGPPIRAVSDPWQNRKWLALSVVAHGTAGFDAWSTRRVISSVPNAQEMNPFLRPFAGNASMYVAVQVLPTALDFVSRRMMNSRHEWARHTWWLPQAVSAVVSLSSGVHNVGVYNSR